MEDKQEQDMTFNDSGVSQISASTNADPIMEQSKTPSTVSKCTHLNNTYPSMYRSDMLDRKLKDLILNEHQQMNTTHVMKVKQHTKWSDESVEENQIYDYRQRDQPRIWKREYASLMTEYNLVDKVKRLTNKDTPEVVNDLSKRCCEALKNQFKNFQMKNIFDKQLILKFMSELYSAAYNLSKPGQTLYNSLNNVFDQDDRLYLLLKHIHVGTMDTKKYATEILVHALSDRFLSSLQKKMVQDIVVKTCVLCDRANIIELRTIGCSLLERLCKHSEMCCTVVIEQDGLKSLINQLDHDDSRPLRHCASALASLSLIGGAENQHRMVVMKVHIWLFRLAFDHDDLVKYYACVAIAALLVNKEIEAAVCRSRSVVLIEKFITAHEASAFADLHSYPPIWLQFLLPLLTSSYEAAQKLASYHFCLEAYRRNQNNEMEIFSQIGAIGALTHAASSPNSLVSRHAAVTLKLLGQRLPHKLSQQVPLWTNEDVVEWVKQINFNEFSDKFFTSRVDGDLLLRMDEVMLIEDIGITNSILRKRFVRELNGLKRLADYDSCDSSGLYEFLNGIGPEYGIYTYMMLSVGIDRCNLKKLNDNQLENECKIHNSIHRSEIMEEIHNCSQSNKDWGNSVKTLDCFISYRRNNGSQLASLIKVYLELQGYSVFIDVDKLQAGKFDKKIISSIRQAHNFILVLTSGALDRCINDPHRKDWLHKEIYVALWSNCKIIPIDNNFEWPDEASLPEDIRNVCRFNSVQWVHSYQKACMDKIIEFLSDGENKLSKNTRNCATNASVLRKSSTALHKSPSISKRPWLGEGPLDKRRSLSLNDVSNQHLTVEREPAAYPRSERLIRKKISMESIESVENQDGSSWTEGTPLSLTVPRIVLNNVESTATKKNEMTECSKKSGFQWPSIKPRKKQTAFLRSLSRMSSILRASSP